MALDSTRAGTKGRRPSNRRGTYSRMWRGLEVTQAWPKARGKNLNPKTKAQMEYFRQVQWAFKFSAPDVQISYTQAVAGTPLMPRDLFLMASSGRMHIVRDTQGRKWFSVQARKNISDSLDVIAQLPGQLLARAADGWAPLTPGDIGLVLTSSGPDSVPTWQEPSGGAVFTETVDGLVPAPNEAGGLFLRDDGTWQAAATGGPDWEPEVDLPTVWLAQSGASGGVGVLNTATGDSISMVFNSGGQPSLRAEDAAHVQIWKIGEPLGDGTLSLHAPMPFNFDQRPLLNGAEIALLSEIPAGASVFTETGDGLVPAPNEAGGLYLRDDGTWDAPPATDHGGANTWLAEYVADGTTGTHTFSGIPATYRDLMLVVRGRATTVGNLGNIQLQFNGDTGANYEWSQLEYEGATNFSGGVTGVTQIVPGYLPGSTAVANAPGICEISIADYRGTTFHKGTQSLAVAQSAAAGSTIFEAVGYGRWKNTAAINAVRVFLPSGNFVAGTVISLYSRI